jgi:hypothetical protein
MLTRTVSYAASVLIALMLAGCGTGTSVKTPAATSRGSSISPSPSVTPSAPTSPVSSVPAFAAYSIPTVCTKLVDPATYASTFGDTPLNAPDVTGKPGTQYYTATGVVTPISSPAGTAPKDAMANSIQLRCIWRFPQADITNLYVEIGTIDPSVSASYLDTLPEQKFECSNVNAGRVCRFQEQLVEYPVIHAVTEFVRDRVYIRVSQDNFRTNNLLGAIVKTVWG